MDLQEHHKACTSYKHACELNTSLKINDNHEMFLAQPKDISNRILIWNENEYAHETIKNFK